MSSEMSYSSIFNRIHSLSRHWTCQQVENDPRGPYKVLLFIETTHSKERTTASDRTRRKSSKRSRVAKVLQVLISLQFAMRHSPSVSHCSSVTHFFKLYGANGGDPFTTHMYLFSSKVYCLFITCPSTYQLFIINDHW